LHETCILWWMILLHQLYVKLHITRTNLNKIYYKNIKLYLRALFKLPKLILHIFAHSEIHSSLAHYLFNVDTMRDSAFIRTLHFFLRSCNRFAQGGKAAWSCHIFIEMCNARHNPAFSTAGEKLTILLREVRNAEKESRFVTALMRVFAPLANRRYRRGTATSYIFRGRDLWNFMVPARPDRVLALALETFSGGQTVPSGVNRRNRPIRPTGYWSTHGVAFSQQDGQRLRPRDQHSPQ